MTDTNKKREENFMLRIWKGDKFEYYFMESENELTDFLKLGSYNLNNIDAYEIKKKKINFALGD